MKDLHRRTRGLNLLSELIGEKAWELEQAVFECARNTEMTDYESKIRQMYWNIRQRPELLGLYSWETLVRLDDNCLGEGTSTETWLNKYHEDVKCQHILLHEEHRSEMKEGALKCKRCGSYDISVHQQQTRSADEGITTFCECQQCFLRWKM